tara:strand:+ start:45 stop:368 length:324 start_codon:yes stop_codon:yes gene_type:complete
MRLYQNSKGQWFGTQADARRNSPRDWREVEVPTSKQDLLDWLNLHNFAPKSAGIAPEPHPEPEPKSELLSPHAASWVSWAYETLRRGDKKEAEEMLIKGLKIQKEWV